MTKDLGKKIANNIGLWLPPLVWGIFIFSFSSVTTPRISEVHWQDFVIKKLAHIVEYGVFALLLLRALKGSGLKSKKAFAYALFISIAYGITDEFHQSFTPGREPTVRDAIFDSVGSLVALIWARDLLPRASGKVKSIMFKLGVFY